MEEPFGQEQLLLAELLLAQGRARETLEVATGLDHPRPITYLVYLRQSLMVRIKAAESLHNQRLVGAYEVRVRNLK
jgi:hypothetical protein